MPLIPFDPLVQYFIFARPPSFATLDQGSGLLSITATSEEVGAEASLLRFDSQQTAWRSGPLGGFITVSIDLGVPQTFDTFALGGTNIATVNGWQFKAYPGAPGVGVPLVDQGPGLDCLVRPDSDVLSRQQALRLASSRSHVLARFPEVTAQGIEAIFDTAAGNGGPNFLEASFTFAALQVPVARCLSENGVSFKPLGDTHTSKGGSPVSAARWPLRANSVPFSFLEEADVEALTETFGTTDLGDRILFWATPDDLSSGSYGIFFARAAGSSPGFKIIGSGGIRESNDLDLVEVT